MQRKVTLKIAPWDIIYLLYLYDFQVKSAQSTNKSKF